MLTRALTTVADFFRAGYPTGVPATGYLPLFALLRRRLSDDEVLIVAGRTNGAGPPILQSAATMNIFGFGARPWDDDAETVGAVLASHAAAAVAASPWGSAPTSPLGSRERLGQAKGIIMERYGVDDVAAFEMLRRLADQSDMGLLELAQRVIDTRTKGA